MATLKDPELLARYRKALSYWNFTGYITWTRVAVEWVRANLDGYTERHLGQLMFEFVERGGRINQVSETRPQWLDHKFHYDLVIEIAGRKIYFETRLFDDDPDEPTIAVVNVHDATH